jgi:hypothetical protein
VGLDVIGRLSDQYNHCEFSESSERRGLTEQWPFKGLVRFDVFT